MKKLIITVLMMCFAQGAFGAEDEARVRVGGGRRYETLSLKQLVRRSLSLGFKEAIESLDKDVVLECIRSMKQGIDKTMLPKHIKLNLIQLLLDALQESVTNIPYNIENRDSIQNQILDLFLDSLFTENSPITPDNFLISSLLEFFSLKMTGKNYNFLVQRLKSKDLLSSILSNIHENLIDAAQAGHTGSVRLLIAAGANVNHLAENHNFVMKSALLEAADQGHIDTVILLLASRSEVDLTDSDGCTSLMYAAQTGYIDVVQYLLGAGANVKHVCFDGATALMLAAERGHTEVVEFFIAEGATVNHADNFGKTALMLAEENDHSEIVTLIKEHIAGLETAKESATKKQRIE